MGEVLAYLDANPLIVGFGIAAVFLAIEDVFSGLRLRKANKELLAAQIDAEREALRRAKAEIEMADMRARLAPEIEARIAAEDAVHLITHIACALADKKRPKKKG